jgi:hypothetical protein
MIETPTSLGVTNLDLMANAIDPETVDAETFDAEGRNSARPLEAAPNRVESRPKRIDLSSRHESSSHEPPIDGMAEVCLYRKRTINLLRRYAKLSVETGRLPSVLSSLEFQRKITSYPLHTFEMRSSLCSMWSGAWASWASTSTRLSPGLFYEARTRIGRRVKCIAHLDLSIARCPRRSTN